MENLRPTKQNHTCRYRGMRSCSLLLRVSKWKPAKQKEEVNLRMQPGGQLEVPWSQPPTQRTHYIHQVFKSVKEELDIVYNYVREELSPANPRRSPQYQLHSASPPCGRPRPHSTTEGTETGKVSERNNKHGKKTNLNNIRTRTGRKSGNAPIRD